MTNDERLSALIDNELTVEESREMLDLIQRDPRLARRWQRYHRMRDSLNGYAGSSDSAYNDDLRAAVSAAIDAGKFNSVDRLQSVDPAVAASARFDPVSDDSAVSTKPDQLKSRRSGGDFWAWSSGFAMAATVAAVVIFGLKFGEFNNAVTEPDVQQIVAATPSFTETNGWDRAVEHGNLRWTQSGESVVSGDQARLNALLVRHGEFVAVSGMNGLSGYARFVSFDERER